MSEQTILSETRGAVRLITLNRPSVMNSFSAVLHGELLQALDAAAADAAVRALVITGAGRAFSAGQDLADPALKDPAGGAPDAGAVIERHYRPLATRIRSMPVPVIAAVNGVAAGAGSSFALCCDIVLAARGAAFIQAFGKIGLIPDCGGTWLLPRLIGRARALALVMTGDKLAAEDAERIGLIWKCADDAALMSEALDLAERLAALPVKAMTEARRALDDAMPMGFAEAVSLEARVQRELGRAPDFAEGAAAFLAKRAPKFTDR